MKHPELVETTRNGRTTVLRRVTAEMCPALALHHIEHLGTGEAGSDFCMVRTQLPGSFLIGTVAGDGWVRLDGRWAPCAPGQLSLSPPNVLQACHTAPDSHWKFVWCRWKTGATPGTINRPDTPLIRDFDCAALYAMAEALFAEVKAAAHPTVIHHLLEAWNTTILSYTGAFSNDQRLAKLWARVEEAPGEPWTVDNLAKLAGCSREHLRRLCLAQLGRPPQQQLAWVRLRHAAHLLGTTGEKIETIARQCGYSSAFALSNAFMRSMNCRPSDLRQRLSVRAT